MSNVEELKTIHNFPDYKISRDGKVIVSYVHNTPKLLKPTIHKHSKTASLMVGVGGTTKTVAELVLTTWGEPKPKEHLWAHHIDQNPLNNNIENLEWIEPKEIYIKETYIKKSNNARRRYRPDGTISASTPRVLYQLRVRYNEDGKYYFSNESYLSENNKEDDEILLSLNSRKDVAIHRMKLIIENIGDDRQIIHDMPMKYVEFARNQKEMVKWKHRDDK
jgi:hypothetical protein